MNDGHEPAPKTRLDDLDMLIIAQLREDGRRTFGRIANAVGVSDATVRQRMQRLQDADVMRIVPVVDPMALGVEVRASVGLRVDGDFDEVVDAVVAMPEVDYVVVTTGSFDVLLEVLAEDARDLYRILAAIKKVPGVRVAESFTYMRIAKQTYPWPPTPS